jgi:hypothetical protein
MTLSRAQHRGARQSLVASESVWEFGEWAFGSGRGVVLRASSDDLVAHVCDAAPAPRGHPSPYEGEGIGRSGAV